MLMLEQLQIQHYAWEKHPSGSIKYRDATGDITIKLTQEHIARILPIVADALVAVSKELADNLKSSVITQALPALTVETADGTQD